MRLEAKPVSTNTNPYAGIEFYAPIDTGGTATYNSGLIYSKFESGAGWNKGLLVLASPSGAGSWTDVIAIRNGRTGIGTLDPVTQFHSLNGINNVLWADGFTRNTSAYFRNDFTPSDLNTSYSALFGVENVWTQGTGAGYSVNATFYNLIMTGNWVFAGGAQRSMVGQVTIDSDAAAFTCSTVGLQGKVLFGSNMNTTVQALNGLGQCAFEAFLQSLSGSAGSVVDAFSFRSRPTFAGAVTFTNLYHFHVRNPTGSNAITNLYGIWIDAQTRGTNNYGIILDGDSEGSDIIFGAGQDASIYYDGNDLIIDPQLIGTGGVRILSMKSGATQGAAGAAANELWKTNGHATLPNDVVMIGV